MSPWTRRNSQAHPPLLKQSIVELIGNTPLVRLSRLGAALPVDVELWAKLELMNPSGSIQDRHARQLCLEAMALNPQAAQLIDLTDSWPLAVAYASVGASLGVAIKIYFYGAPSSVNAQRCAMMGAQLVFSASHAEAVEAMRAAGDQPSLPPQAHREAVATSHELTTSPELWYQTQRRLTHVVVPNAPGLLAGLRDGLSAQGGEQVEVIGVISDESSQTPASRQLLARLAAEEGIHARADVGPLLERALALAASMRQGVVVVFVGDRSCGAGLGEAEAAEGSSP